MQPLFRSRRDRLDRLRRQREEAVEAAARETGLPGRMIPIPSEVSAGCGLAWCVPAEERDALLDTFESGGLAYEAVHEVELY